MLIPEDITDDEKEKLLALLEFYMDVIVSDNDLGCTKVLHHNIDTGSASPIRQPVRRLSLPAKEEVKKLLGEMLQKTECNLSINKPLGVADCIGTEKDGLTRFCVDYRKVNYLTRKDAYPIPKIDETLDTLAGAKLFSIYTGSEEWILAGASQSMARTLGKDSLLYTRRPL